MALSTVNVAIIEVGMATAAIRTERRLSNKEHDHQGSEYAPQQEMLFQPSDGCFDEDGVVPDDLHGNAGG
jgi:hypothetical protein